MAEVVPMTFFRALVYIGICALLASTVGCLIGLVLGIANPDYFRAVFPHVADWPAISIVGFASSIGVVQGMMVGIFVGIVVVGILAWQYGKVVSRR
jgi:hypothetical protein